jgi:hypothetical protein
MHIKAFWHFLEAINDAIKPEINAFFGHFFHQIIDSPLYRRKKSPQAIRHAGCKVLLI